MFSISLHSLPPAIGCWFYKVLKYILRQWSKDAATIITAINAYRPTGILHINQNIFTDAYFTTAETTGSPEPAHAAAENTVKPDLLMCS